MPFGLKVAPSLFKKAMPQIFEPILHSALIYIDDILLFSKEHEALMGLFSMFHQLMEKYGIMLSARKSILGSTTVEFLGIILKDGKYLPGPHIAQELLNFPDQQLSRKQLQQFLGIINYLRDFLPHVADYTSNLSLMLKKTAPPWGSAQITAVQKLK